MNPQPPILFVVDATDPASPGLGKALALAKATQRPLELLLVDYDPTAAAAEHIKERVLEADEQIMRDITHKAREAGLDVNWTVDWSRPAEDTILSAAESSQPWLLAKDAQDYSLIERMLFANTDEQLLRECSVPLYFSKPKRLPASPTWLAAIDPCRDEPEALNDEILQLTASMAAFTRGTAAAAHVFQPPTAVTFAASMAGPTGPAATAVSLVESVNELRDIHRKAFHELLDRSNIDFSCRRFVDGPVDTRLASVAEELDADVMVTGYTQNGPVADALTSSTAEKLLKRSACDLLVLKQAA